MLWHYMMPLSSRTSRLDTMALLCWWLMKDDAQGYIDYGEMDNAMKMKQTVLFVGIEYLR